MNVTKTNALFYLKGKKMKSCNKADMAAPDSCFFFFFISTSACASSIKCKAYHMAGILKLIKKKKDK